MLRLTPPRPQLLRRLYSTTDYSDIVIIGGGPAGLALGAGLAQNPSISGSHSITLIDGGKLSDAPPTGPWSNRVSSVTARSIGILERCGAWAGLDASRTRDIDTIRAWDGRSGAAIEFHARDLHASHLSRLVENANLQAGCLRAMRSRVDLRPETRVASIARDEFGWPVLSTIGPDGPRSLRARLLIGADGANSPVKAFSGIETFGRVYGRNGVVGTLHCAGGHTAFQRFLPAGPLAFLPLSDTHASMVWSTTPEMARVLRALPADALPALIDAGFRAPYEQLKPVLDVLEQWGAKLAAASEAAAAATDAVVAVIAELHAGLPPPDETTPPSISSVTATSVAAFPLRLSHTDSYLGRPIDGRDQRTVLVGDAAHTIHPLGGQGLNMGLYDGESLVNVIAGIVQQGGDIGQYLNLQAYPRARYFENHCILSACDHMHDIFSCANPLAVNARSTGIEVLNELDSLKRLMMVQGGSAAPDASGPVNLVIDGLQSAISTARFLKIAGESLVSQVMGKVGQA